MGPVVSLVGGSVSVAALLDEMVASLPIGELRVRLVAQDVDRVHALARHGQHLVADRRGWQVEACGSLAAAVDGATVVVLMLRVGGLEARRTDELLAHRFGLPADEGLGPGGAANALRTLPVIDEIAADLVREAPQAMVLNLVAPLGLTTRVLLDRGVDTIGVCELPGVTERALSSVLDGQVELAYGGFNHLGWFWPEPDEVRLLEPAVAARLVDPAVLERFGAVPLKYYYWLHDPPAAARLGIARDPDRSVELIELRDRARDEIASRPHHRSAAVGARPTPWFADALAPMLAGLLAGREWTGYANLRNDTLIPDLAPEVVVEVPARIGADGAAADAGGPSMPSEVLRFTRRVERSEQLLHAAWLEQDVSRLAASFTEGPHGLDADTARGLAEALSVEVGVGNRRDPVGSPRL